MYVMDWEIRTQWTTSSKKLDHNVRHGVRNKKEVNDLEKEIRSKCTNWNNKLDRNVRHGVRNKNEMNDLE